VVEIILKITFPCIPFQPLYPLAVFETTISWNLLTVISTSTVNNHHLLLIATGIPSLPCLIGSSAHRPISS
jgi:hypothetical protein